VDALEVVPLMENLNNQDVWPSTFHSMSRSEMGMEVSKYVIPCRVWWMLNIAS
jgi:hypothetical protein